MQKAVEQPGLVDSIPYWGTLAGMLNTLDYCESVLREWADQVIFLELMQYETNMTRNTPPIPNATTTSGDSALSTLLSSMPLLPSVLGPSRTPTNAAASPTAATDATSPSSSKQTNNEDVPSGSFGLFAPIIIEYNEHKTNVLHWLVDTMCNKWHASCAAYRTTGHHMIGGPALSDVS
jgi:hypothetical protein